MTDWGGGYRPGAIRRPHPKEAVVAEAKKTTGKTVAADSPEPVNQTTDTPRAAESGDPAVHQLLAQRQTAEQNGDDEVVKDVDRKLSDLGFSV